MKRSHYVTVPQIQALRGLAALPTRPNHIVRLMDKYYDKPESLTPQEWDVLLDWTEANDVQPEDYQKDEGPSFADRLMEIIGGAQDDLDIIHTVQPYVEPPTGDVVTAEDAFRQETERLEAEKKRSNMNMLIMGGVGLVVVGGIAWALLGKKK